MDKPVSEMVERYAREKYRFVVELNGERIGFRTSAARESFLAEWGREGDIAILHDYPPTAALGDTNAA